MRIVSRDAMNEAGEKLVADETFYSECLAWKTRPLPKCNKF